MLPNQIALWVYFNVFIVLMLCLDALVFHRKDKEVRMGEAVGWSLFWISLALIFNLGVYKFYGKEKALQFLTGYLIEESLSIDNLFVFLLIFSYFKVPAQYQHKILFWGIVGAQVMRAVFIFSGLALLHRFSWIVYIFGLFLVISGIKLFLEKEKEMDAEKNWALRFFGKFFPVTDDYAGGKFFVKRNGGFHVTPLFIVLIVIDTTDLIFAIDSIPAVLAITTDPFIVYTSNVFAILGLRALYFALAGMMKVFYYLHYALGAILVFVGLKMLLEEIIHIPIHIALGFIGGSFFIAVMASILFPVKRLS